jgi:hypothetical protein
MKKRRRPRRITPRRIDEMTEHLERCWRGAIPWSPEGLAEVNAFVLKLLQMPKDDWPVSPPVPITIEDTQGRVEKFHINTPISQKHILIQVMNFIYDKYDADVAPAHVARWDAIGRFLTKHEERLIADGWMIRDDQLRANTALYAAFAVLPFSVEDEDNCEEIPLYTFDYDEVDAFASKLQGE